MAAGYGGESQGGRGESSGGDFLALVEWLRGLQLTAHGSMGPRFALPGAS
jgi:hypothetical protein